MSTPINAFAESSFISTGGVFTLPIRFSPTYFRMLNQTNQNSTANPGVVKKAEWFASLAPASAFIVKNSDGTATDQSSLITSNGITLIDTSVSTPGALNSTITAISTANPAVVSLTSTTGISSGAIVSMYDTTGMQQIGGWDFTVGTVVANTSFQLAYLNSAAFSAAGTGGSLRVRPYNPYYYPRNRLITSITQATSAVVQMSVTHGFTPGQLVRILVPDAFGMSQINGQLGTVTAINTTTNTITINIDSSGYSAFAFPTSATALAGVTFPQVVPVGEAATAPFQNLLDDATTNQSVIALQLGSGVVGAPGDVISWIAASGVIL